MLQIGIIKEDQDSKQLRSGTHLHESNTVIKP